LRRLAGTGRDVAVATHTKAANFDTIAVASDDARDDVLRR
jgi:hypothetical protein